MNLKDDPRIKQQIHKIETDQDPAMLDEERVELTRLIDEDRAIAAGNSHKAESDKE